MSPKFSKQGPLFPQIFLKQGWVWLEIHQKLLRMGSFPSKFIIKWVQRQVLVIRRGYLSENRYLSIYTASCGRKLLLNFQNTWNFKTLVRKFTIDKFAQKELVVVQFTQRQVLLIYYFFCFSLFQFIVT